MNIQGTIYLAFVLASGATIWGADDALPATRPAAADPAPADDARGDKVKVPVPVPAPADAVPTRPEAAPADDAHGDKVKVPVPGPSDVGDLRDLIGITHDFARVEMGNMPEMSMRGFIQPKNPEKPAIALLEIKQLKRLFLVHEGTEIPVMVTGRVTPVARNELAGLGDTSKAAPPPVNDAQQQSQIILRVVKVSAEGVTVKAGLMAQTIIIR